MHILILNLAVLYIVYQKRKNTFIIIFIFIYQEKLTILLNYHTNLKEKPLLFI